MRKSVVPALFLALVAGAVPAAAGATESVAVDPAPRVVVAPIDSGINPYHERFQVENYGLSSSVTQDVLDEFGIDDDHVLTLSDTYAEDAELWATVKAGERYHFTGTNIIAIDTSNSALPILPDSSSDTHGVGVSGSVVRGNPEAIIYFIEGTGTAGETEAFTNPAVDMVTTSYGFPTAVPLGNLTESYDGVVTRGKAHFGASPNDPSIASIDGTSGPWWGYSIAGYAEGDDNGKEITSGSVPEFVADFTQDLPYCQTCTTGTRNVSGTSFATPYSAGIASAVLLEARREAGHVGGITSPEDGALMVDAGGIQISTWDLRRAMQQAAVDPGQSGVPILTYPGSPVANYTIVGWGALTADPELNVIGRALGALEIGDNEAPAAKSADTCEYMNAHFDARLVAWDANILSDSFGGFDSDGYIYC